MHRLKLVPLPLILLLSFSARKAEALAPPWFTLWNQILHSVGDDPAVTVDPLDTTSSAQYVVTLHVNDATKAQQLATIITPSFALGGITVVVRVLDPSGNTPKPLPIATNSALAGIFTGALATNRRFVGAFAYDYLSVGDAAGVIWTRSNVQFPNDDIGELYGNYNATAAAVFGIVLRTDYGPIDAHFGTQHPGAILELFPEDSTSKVVAARKK